MNIMMFTHVAVEVTASVYPAWLWLLPGLCQGEIANDQKYSELLCQNEACLLKDGDYMYKLALLVLLTDVPLS